MQELAQDLQEDQHLTSKDSTPKLVYSVTEVAGMLGISRSSAYEYVRTGELPSISIGGRKLVPHNALTKMLEAT